VRYLPVPLKGTVSEIPTRGIPVLYLIHTNITHPGDSPATVSTGQPHTIFVTSLEARVTKVDLFSVATVKNRFFESLAIVRANKYVNL